MYSCHQAIRKDVYFEVEGFNPEQFGRVVLGDGEAGLNTKLRAAGYKFAYTGKDVTFHVVPPTRMTQAFLNRRIGISGANDAYRQYRKYTPSPLQLFFWNVKLIFVSIPLHLATYIIKVFVSRDPDLGRFFIPYTYYYRNRIGYNQRLMRSEKWRAFAQKKDWMSNDHPLDPEIIDYIEKN